MQEKGRKFSNPSALNFNILIRSRYQYHWLDDGERISTVIPLLAIPFERKSGRVIFKFPLWSFTEYPRKRVKKKKERREKRKRERARMYTSMTGRKLEGPAAVTRQREGESTNPGVSERKKNIYIAMKTRRWIEEGNEEEPGRRVMDERDGEKNGDEEEREERRERKERDGQSRRNTRRVLTPSFKPRPRGETRGRKRRWRTPWNPVFALKSRSDVGMGNKAQQRSASSSFGWSGWKEKEETSRRAILHRVVTTGGGRNRISAGDGGRRLAFPVSRRIFQLPRASGHEFLYNGPRPGIKIYFNGAPHYPGQAFAP